MLILFFALFAAIRADPLTKAENENRLATCGSFSTTKILNGAEVAQIEAPWSLFIHNGGTVCTGTLVSSRHILTATHCFAGIGIDRWETLHEGHFDRKSCRDGNYEITDSKLLNEISFESNGSIIAEFPEKVTLIKACELVNSTTKKKAALLLKDFTIVELYEDLKFSPILHPVCVSEDKDDNKIGTQLELYGFGLDPPKDLNQRVRDNSGVLRYEIIESVDISGMQAFQFMANNTEAKTIACSGDSGGGAIAQVNQKKTIVGVLSQTTCMAVRLKRPLGELYNSVGFYYETICEITGICKSEDYDGKHYGYVRQTKPVRKLASGNEKAENLEKISMGQVRNRNESGKIFSFLVVFFAVSHVFQIK